MPDPGSILVVGGDSNLGSGLIKWFLEHGHDVWHTTRHSETAAGRRLFLDLAQDVSAWTPPRSFRTAYFCAACTSMEFCERNQELSESINVHRTTGLAGTLIASGTQVVFLSTNQVFDGSVPRRLDSSAVCPRNEYGRQKALTERNLLALDPRSAVVRLTKVLTPGLQLFIEWKKRLLLGQTIQPFKDMWFAPVPFDFAVETLARIGLDKRGGLFQVSPEDDISYAGAAFRMADKLGAHSDLVQPISYADKGLAPTAAPRHTTLDATRLKMELRLVPPTAEEALDWLFERLP